MGRYRIPMAEWNADVNSAIAKYVPIDEVPVVNTMHPDFVEVHTEKIETISDNSLPPTGPSPPAPTKGKKKKKGGGH